LKIVYHRGLTFGSRLLNMFHPFEFDRAEVALERLRRELGDRLESMLLQPSQPVELSELRLVHTADYLDSLSQNSVIARVMEVPFLSFCPRRWVEGWFLKPAAWSVACSLLAARASLREGLGVSLGGGFHHAKRDGGEGFCLVNDIAFLIETLRSEGTLAPEDRILYLDLDVHQGNGVSDYYRSDPSVRLLDAFNQEIYPVYGGRVGNEVEVALPLRPGCMDELYLETVEEGVDKLMSASKDAKFMIYNAGTDVYAEDRLGGLALTVEGVRKRDRMVLRKAKAAGIPLLILASGGYSKMSAVLLSDMVLAAVEEFA
jgi:histone deacetylase 11